MPLRLLDHGRFQLTSILKFSSKRGIATSPTVAILGKAFANAEGSIRYLAPGLSITDIFEDECFRSRHEDRADARARQWRRAAIGAAAAVWFDRRRRPGGS